MQFNKLRHMRWLLMIVMLLMNGVTFGADRADAILGVWTTQDGKARVEIRQQNGMYAGRIVWLKEPLFPVNDPQGMAGKPKVDRKNPEAALQTRPIIGLLLVNGFHYAGDSVWSGGTIYDPESGKTYSCKISLMANGFLKLRGYVGISLFGRTEIWQRYVPDAATPAATAKTI
jgi:uncharacterized protein (DUF2147 family)